MKLKVITYKDGSMGFDSKAISIGTVGGVIDSIETVELDDKKVREVFEKPDKFELKDKKLIERKVKKGK